MEASRWKNYIERTVIVLSSEIDSASKERDELTSKMERIMEAYNPESPRGPSPTEGLRIAKTLISTTQRMIAQTISSIFLVSDEDLQRSAEKASIEARNFLTKEVSAEILNILRTLREIESVYRRAHSRTFHAYEGAASSYDEILLRLHKDMKEKLMDACSTITPIFEAALNYKKLLLSKMVKEFILLGVKG